MAFAPPNPMIARCKKCGWSHTQSSDVIQLFSSCPQCGSEELELSFAKGSPFDSSPNGESGSGGLLQSLKNLFKS